MPAAYVDNSYKGTLFFKSPWFFFGPTLAVGLLLSLPIYRDYRFCESALPYQAYVLSETPHGAQGLVDYYDLEVQFQPPGQGVRQLLLRSRKDYPEGSRIPIAYDPHPGGDVRVLGTRMSFWGEVLPAFLVRWSLAAAFILLFEFRSVWRRLL